MLCKCSRIVSEFKKNHNLVADNDKIIFSNLACMPIFFCPELYMLILSDAFILMHSRIVLA